VRGAAWWSEAIRVSGLWWSLPPGPAWIRKIMPSLETLRASSEACGCAKPAGSTVEPAIGRHGRVTMIQF